MLPLDVDPNMVVAGWIPVVVILVMAVAAIFLFRSMRTQMRRIDIPEEGVDTHPESARSRSDG